MSEEKSNPLDSLPISATQLGWVYIAGIALNLVAVVFAVRNGQTFGAVTLGFIITYLAIRYWQLQSS